MFRTLILTAVLALIKFFKSPITRAVEYYEEQRKRRLFSNTPSQGLIDQLLPLEVLCHIISAHDIVFLRRCKQVSKYWNTVASSIPPQHFLNQIDRLSRPTIEELKRDLALNESDDALSAIKWLKYPDWYNLQFLYDDANLASQMGQKMIDAEISDVLRIANLSKEKNVFDKTNEPQYLIKTRGKLRRRRGCYSIHDPETDEEIKIPFQSIKKWTPIVEIITELAAVKLPNDRIDESKIHVKRSFAKPPPKGIIPKKSALYDVLFCLYTPCLASDLFHLLSAAPQMYDAFRLIIACASCGCVVLFLQVAGYGGNLWYAITSVALDVIVTALAMWTGPFLDFTTFVAYIFAVGVFEAAVNSNKEYVRQNYRYEKLIRRICFGLFILTVDWTTAIESIIDGSIWTYFFRNLAYSTYAALYFLTMELARKKWQYQFQDINTPTMIYYLRRICAFGLFYTFYAPAFVQAKD